MGEVVGLEGHNADNVPFDASSVLELVDEMEREQEKIDARNEKAKEENAPHRDSIAQLRKQARDEFNVEASALSLIVAKRRQERRISQREQNLKERAAEQYGLFGKEG